MQACYTDLVVQFQPELDFPRIMRSCDRTEVAARVCGANVFELRMVPGIEGFHTEFETAAAFIESKALEQSYVPVLATRAVYRVPWEIAKVAGSRRG